MIAVGVDTAFLILIQVGGNHRRAIVYKMRENAGPYTAAVSCHITEQCTKHQPRQKAKKLHVHGAKYKSRYPDGGMFVTCPLPEYGLHATAKHKLLAYSGQYSHNKY